MVPASEKESREFEGELRRTGALLEGHFVLSSGLHSPRYIQCAQLLQHPVSAERAGRAVAALFPDFEPQAVLSPALGGIVLGHEVARALGVRAIFAERVNGEMRLRRGFAISPSERLLLVEDVATTGRSIGELVELARGAGAVPVAVGALVDRSSGRLALGLPTRAVLTLAVPVYRPEECPSCREGIPLEKPGSRAMPELRKNT